MIHMSLATLAMGDTQAVELAQTCHLGLGYQHKIICPENLLSLQSPPPRGQHCSRNRDRRLRQSF